MRRLPPKLRPPAEPARRRASSSSRAQVDAMKVTGQVSIGVGRPEPDRRGDGGIPAELRETMAVFSNLGMLRG